ncbi:hypothetical protein K503DRAFT_799695 [Rhizopogon vinicolor AM-OR11-026]|uniref:Auxin efflux carrier n=1 Tax=Rhizopogon vinicolor AM-OR11-026 TaxID=1314800 RepID=A0A1B7N3J7_9AGAM|nr:hypothetical protein K503DRAFT_799695 [Rhizopogon vinicolor AM-OR11-026]
MVVSITVSKISVVKALFIPDVPGTNIPPAPDGQPPLAFTIDAAAFLGAANCPVELIIFGSAVASIPHGIWISLPLGSIGALTVSKQLIMPALGIFICSGLLGQGSLTLQIKFSDIFVSCLPTAIAQVILIQAACSDTGTAEHLVPFLLPQYIVMLCVMTASMAFTLILLFG